MVEENITTCYDCGEEINMNEDEYRETRDGDIICMDCYENDYFTCDDCGDIFHNDDATYTHNGRVVCQNCLDNYYSYCDGCNEYYDEDNVSYCEEEDAYLCDNCQSRVLRDREENNGYYIHGYHDRDIPITYLYEEEDLENNSLSRTSAGCTLCNCQLVI